MHTRRNLGLELLEDRKVLSGIVLTSIGDSDFASSCFLQDDGNIVVAGSTSPGSDGSQDFAVVRYERDGILDQNFGTGGVVTTPFVNGFTDGASAVVAYPDGRILAAGYASAWNKGHTDADFALARYNSDGSLDKSFGRIGKVRTDLGGKELINDVVVSDDGRIFAVGQFPYTIACYTDDGDLDTSFGEDGMAYAQIGDRWDIANAVVIHKAANKDDGIVAVGQSRNDETIPGGTHFGLARFTLDGDLDTEFGNNGTVLSDFGVEDYGDDWAEAATVDADGNIVVVGNVRIPDSPDTSPYDWAVARYLPNGVPDPTFGEHGVVLTDVTGYERANAVAIQSDGSIVSAGFAYVPGTSTHQFAVVRHLESGEIDTSFGDEGVVLTQISNGCGIQSVVIQPDDGKIVVAGWTDTDSGRDIALARYNPDGSLDDNFGVQNDPPDALDDTATTDEDTAIDIDVLANDADDDEGNVLTITSTTDPSHGSVAINPDNTVTYTPSLNFNGTDTFSYTISDGNGGSDTAMVNITVEQIQDGPPTADAGGPYTVAEGGTVVLDASDTTDPDLPYETLIYAWDLDGDGVFGETDTGARGGEVGIAPTFNAAGLAVGTEVSVAVRVTDSTLPVGLSDIATATITVEAVPSELEFTSSGDPINIGDNKTVSSPIVVSGTGVSIVSLAIQINLTHANPSDLTARIVSPNGTPLAINEPILSDDYTHLYVISGAKGLDLDGTWTLQVTDHTRDKKKGSLIKWTMIVEPSPSEAAMAALMGESMMAASQPLVESSTVNSISTKDLTLVDTLFIEQPTDPVAVPTTDEQDSPTSPVDEAFANLDTDQLDDGLLDDLALAAF